MRATASECKRWVLVPFCKTWPQNCGHQGLLHTSGSLFFTEALPLVRTVFPFISLLRIYGFLDLPFRFNESRSCTSCMKTVWSGALFNKDLIYITWVHRINEWIKDHWYFCSWTFLCLWCIYIDGVYNMSVFCWILEIWDYSWLAGIRRLCCSHIVNLTFIILVPFVASIK